MKLFWYESSSTYSEERYLVRADSLERAKELAGATSTYDVAGFPEDEWAEVTADGPEGVLYAYERSYDTGGH